MSKQIARGLALAGVLVSVAGAAMADVPAGVTTAITSGGTDGLAVVGALAAAGASFLLIRKVLAKTGITL